MQKVHILNKSFFQQVFLEKYSVSVQKVNILSKSFMQQDILAEI